MLIPEAVYKLTPELEKIDKLLQDESYEYPIDDRFNTQRGRQRTQILNGIGRIEAKDQRITSVVGNEFTSILKSASAVDKLYWQLWSITYEFRCYRPLLFDEY